MKVMFGHSMNMVLRYKQVKGKHTLLFCFEKNGGYSCLMKSEESLSHLELSALTQG